MPSPAILLLTATLLPLLSFVVLLFFGKKIGNPLAGWFASLAMGGSFLCSAVAMVAWINGGTTNGVVWGDRQLPIVSRLPWIPIGEWRGQTHSGFLDVGMYIDSLTLVMFCMITLVATFVHVFSIGYMRDDQRYARFFTYLGLFCFSMLGLVIGGTLLQLFIFWELVGFCSYLLIGFWYERRAPQHAAMKAFIVNRVGDFGFLIGLGLLVYHLGNVTLPEVWIALGHAGSGMAATLPGGGSISTAALTAIGIGLFFGAVGKSAQFPLHVWLADAMEGPTPVSALIHAATMVAAGVYLVARIFPLLTPDAKLFIAIIGTITLTMGALIATTQSDIKKVLAFSTLSQLGYMILALGIGSWVGGMFHLITHAFFKSLLFLAAGSVIHAAGHEQEMPQFGGLLKKIPVTGVTFLIAVLAISGTGFGEYGFAGYYSKDMILAHAGAFAAQAERMGRSPAYWIFFALPTGVAYLTAFYMMRCWTLTFWGKPRNQPLARCGLRDADHVAAADRIGDPGDGRRHEITRHQFAVAGLDDGKHELLPADRSTIRRLCDSVAGGSRQRQRYRRRTRPFVSAERQRVRPRTGEAVRDVGVCRRNRVRICHLCTRLWHGDEAGANPADRVDSRVAVPADVFR